MNSNEPGLEMGKKPAHVNVKEENNLVPAGPVLPLHPPPLNDELARQRYLNNQKIKGTFETENESRPHKAVASHPGAFIENPDFARNHPLIHSQQHTPPPASSSRYMSFNPIRSHDFIPVQDSFPYQFVAKSFPSGGSLYDNGLDSLHSVPHEVKTGVKGRTRDRNHYSLWYPAEHHERRQFPPLPPSLRPTPPTPSVTYEQPLPVFEPRYRPSNKSVSPQPPYAMPIPDNYYANVYPDHSARYRQPPTYQTPASPFAFESTRIKPVNDYGTTTPSTNGYMHPLPVRPDDNSYRPTFVSSRPLHPLPPPQPSANYPPIPRGVDYLSTPSSRPSDNNGYQHLPPPPPGYYPVTTSRPYTHLPPRLPPRYPPPHTESSLERPLQYLDGPGPGAIVGTSRMEPTVFYADDEGPAHSSHPPPQSPPLDQERLEKLAREVYNYVPDSRTGEPPGEPPSDYGYHHHSPPDRIEPSSSYPLADNGRSKLASYYHSIKHSPGISTTVKTTEDVPSVLLGIQSALGLEGISTTSSNDIDNNYSPSHYPSYDQIVLLRKGLRKLIPILAKQSASSSSKSSKLSVSSSTRFEKEVPVDSKSPSLLTSSAETSRTSSSTYFKTVSSSLRPDLAGTVDSFQRTKS